jgi:hypothetical protein
MKHLAFALLLTLSAASLFGCRGDGGLADGARNETHELDVAALSPNGCLDMQLVSEHLRRIESTAYSRRFTTDVTSEAQDNKSRMIAAKGAFVFVEGPLADEMQAFPVVAQLGCQSATFTSGSAEETYTIDGFSGTHVSMKNADGTRTKIFRIVNSKTIEEQTKFTALNPCGALDEMKLSVTQALRWGTRPEIEAISQEVVSSDMLKRLKSATAFTGSRLPGPLPAGMDTDIPGSRFINYLAQDPQPTPPPQPPQPQPPQPQPAPQPAPQPQPQPEPDLEEHPRPVPETRPRPQPSAEDEDALGNIPGGAQGPIVFAVADLRQLAKMPIDPSYLQCAPRKGKAVRVETHPEDEEDEVWSGQPRGNGGGEGQSQPARPTPTPTPTPPRR